MRMYQIIFLAAIYSKWNKIPCEGWAFSCSLHEYHDAALLCSVQLKWTVTAWNWNQSLPVQPRKVQPTLILYVPPYRCCFDLFYCNKVMENRQMLPTSRSNAIIVLIFTRIQWCNKHVLKLKLKTKLIFPIALKLDARIFIDSNKQEWSLHSWWQF